MSGSGHAALRQVRRFIVALLLESQSDLVGTLRSL